jgi:hypothetical protein
MIGRWWNYIPKLPQRTGSGLTTGTAGFADSLTAGSWKCEPTLIRLSLLVCSRRIRFSHTINRSHQSKRLMFAIVWFSLCPPLYLGRFWFLYPAASQPLIRNFCSNSRKALALQSPRRREPLRAVDPPRSALVIHRHSRMTLKSRSLHEPLRVHVTTAASVNAECRAIARRV